MASDTPNKVLTAIRREMSARGISQRGLARTLGWNPIYTHRRISGAVGLTVPEIEQIADALGVPLAQLISATDSTATPESTPRPEQEVKDA